MSDIVYADCQNVVNYNPEHSGGDGIIIAHRVVPKEAEEERIQHREIRIELRMDGYYAQVERWAPRGNAGWDDIQWVRMLLKRVPHPDDPRRQDDDVWLPLPWVEHLNGSAVSDIPREISEYIVDVIRTDSFYRLR